MALVRRDGSDHGSDADHRGWCFWLCLCLLALTLGACATPPGASPAVPARTQAAAAFTLEGRLAVKEGEQGSYGQVSWQHQPGQDRLEFRTPLGQLVARLQWDGQEVVLEQPGEAPLRAPSVEELTRRTIGFPLPLAYLVQWVQGLPVAQLPFQPSHDEQGRLRSLNQDGWVIDFENWQSVSGQALPGRLFARKGELDLRLVVHQWDTHD